MRITAPDQARGASEGGNGRKAGVGMETRIRKVQRRNDVLIVGILLCTVLLFYYLPNIIVFVRAGEAGVKFRRLSGGTVIDRVYPEGVHFLFPWDTMQIYNVRFQATNIQFTILSESGLSLTMDLTIRYRPMYDLLGVLHQQVGPMYVQTIVVPEVKSAIRTTLGEYTSEEIYTSQRALLDKVVDKAAEEAAQRYVEIDDVVIERITVPEYIKSAIETKLAEREVLESYKYRLQKEEQEKERKIIEAEGYAEANRLLTNTLTEAILKWKGIEATRQLSMSTNTKVIVIGNGSNGLPVIMGNP